MKSSVDIKADVFNHLRDSSLMDEVSGGLYKSKRPKDSRLEDVVISVIGNVNGQIQTCVLNVNIYTEAVLVDGQPEEDLLRTQTLSRLACDVLDVFRGEDFRAVLTDQTIFEADGADEYVINNRIEYKQLNE